MKNIYKNNMATSDSASFSEPGNDLMLLERVFLRLGSADSDEQLEQCVGKFLPPVLLKLASPHEQVRTKVMELLVHINKRVRCRSTVQLPMDALLSMYQDEKATSFVINFTIIYLTMGFPRLPADRQLELIPRLLTSIASRPQSHQDDILLLVMPVLGDLGNKSPSLNLKDRPQQAKVLVRLALDLLLLPYGALPGNKEAGSEFPVPPGLSMVAYKKMTDKHILDASQLEKTKQSIVKFLNSDALEDSDTLLPLIVAAADSRFSVANIASVGLGRIVSSVDWNSGRVVLPLYTLFLGGGGPAPRAPSCTRIRLKLLHYLNRATGAAILYPHCIQVIFASLFAQNTNPRLKTLALNFTMNAIQSGDVTQLKQISPVLLGGLLKLTKMEDEWAHHAQAYTCIGRLVAKAPCAMTKQFETLEELFNKMPTSPPDLRLALREALLAMAGSFTIRQPATSAGKSESMEVDVTSGSPAAGTSSSSKAGTSAATPMEVDQDPTPGVDSSNAPLIVALLEKHMDSEDAMVRFVAARYASVLFPRDSPASKYLLLLASGDPKDEVKMEALKSLYGVTRPSEIEDIVQNVTPTASEQKVIKNDEKEEEAALELAVPAFHTMVEYIWANIAKRKESSNSKHRFVMGNHVLPYPPNTYYEVMRYLRMCLNRSAGIKDGSPHPGVTSPVLAIYLSNRLQSSPESLQHYLSMIKLLLTACPDIVPFTCLLEIVGCIPQIMSKDFVELLVFFRTHFTGSMREDVRDTAATLYGIVQAHSATRTALDVDVLELLGLARANKSLEAQCGLMAAACSLLERSITLWKTKALQTLGDPSFNVKEWKPYIDCVTYLAECLSSNHNLIVSYACANIALLGKCYALPLTDRTEKDKSNLIADITDPKEVPVKAPENPDGAAVISKLTVVNRLFAVLKSAKFTSKIKEKATTALGLICIGEHFPHSKEIVKGFLEMAKETKDFEIHLQIGESLVHCVDGVNSVYNRDLWSQPSPEGSSMVFENKALTENDQLLEWLLTELLEFVTVPHPNSRQACCIWLLALLKNCSNRTPIKSRLADIQDAFMEFLSENNDIVQDVASKGLGLVYTCCGEEERRTLVERLLEQLTGGRRTVAQVTQDTKVFEDGQLGKTPAGGNLSTYKELCSFASDLNQPDLIYKFMHLANHNAMWNSKKGAAFGFQSIIQQAGAQLSEHLPKIVPRLYRYRFDPTPKIQNSMSSIWHALVPETNKTVEKYHAEILNDLVGNITANQWRVRMSCCLALSDLLRVTRSMTEFLPRLAEIWSQLYRVMDDVHEGTRVAAANTTAVLSKLCIQATDVDKGKSGKDIMAAILPVILNTGITHTVAEIRQISLQTVSKMVGSAGPSLTPFLPQLIPGLLQAAGELESSRLSYLSAALGAQHQTQEAVDSLRAHAAKAHYTTDTVTKCIQYVDVPCVEAMLPAMLDLLKGPALGSKVAVAHALGLLAHQLNKELQEVAGKVLSALLHALLDRNSTVRKHAADTIGTFIGCAKDSSVDKLMTKLCTWYKERDDEAVRSAIALTFQAISNRHSEMLKDRSKIVMPTLFFAMHAEKTPETTSTVEIYEEVWGDISPSKELGIRNHLEPICACLKEAVSSPSWGSKAQGARGLGTVGREAGQALGAAAAMDLLMPLLEALKGRSWPGKEALLRAIATLCRCASEDDGAAELWESVVESVMRECGKKEPVYRRHCLSALGDVLLQLKMDRFQQVYDILKDTLDKDVSSICKDSDDDEFSNEESLKKKEQLILLKEVSYETLGKAWPENKETQEKYQLVFVSHCAECIASNTRSVQVAILTALGLYVERLVLFKECPIGSSDLQTIISHIVKLLDYSFSIGKNTRLRKEALNVMNTLGKKIKESKNTQSLEELKKLYTKFEGELVGDNAPEVRSRLVQTKLLFQP